MKPLALSRLNSILERKENSAIYGKNGLVYPKVRNEKGFKVSSSSLPYDYYIGCIETDENPIIFTGDGTNSAIGFYDVDEDLYVPILDDASLTYKLNFNPSGFIQGEARRNYLGELEIVWLDSHNIPRFLNTEKTLPSELHLLNLFMSAVQPTLELELLQGGFLKKGAYYVGIKYISEDEAETGYFTLQGPIYTYNPNYGGQIDANTSFSLRLSVNNMDTNFSKFKFVIVSNIAGVVTAKETDEFPMTGNGEFTYVYSNNNIGTDTTLEEVLIPSAFYENAKAITQENDILYLGNTSEPEQVNLQQYFIDATLKWTSQIVDIKDPDLKSGKKKTLKHGEVYAFYGVVRWKNGQKSEAYTIPGPTGGNTSKVGRTLFGGETVTVRTSVLNANWTLTDFSILSRSGEGTMLPWVNENENYPNIPEFGSRAGQPVVHHILPTVGWCGRNMYDDPIPPATASKYGVSELDILGVKLENLNFPPEIQSQIESIEIYHAKREYGSTLVYSQGVMIPSAISTSSFDSGKTSVVEALDEIQTRFRNGYTTNQNGVRLNAGNPFFTGTNLMFDTNEADPNNYWTIPFDYFYAFHSPETLIDRFIPNGYPAIKGNGFLVTKYNPSLGKGSSMRKVSRIMDSTVPSTIFDTNPANTLIIGEKAFYLVNDQKGYNVDNAKSEGKLVVQAIQEGESLAPLWIPSGREEDLTQDEYLTMGDMVNCVIRDVYPNFYSRELVKLGKIDSEGKVFGGDTFICEFGFNTMGIYTAKEAEWKLADGNPITDVSLQWYRRVIVESTKNLWLRYIDPANPYDKFFPGNINQISPDRLEFPNNVEINTVSMPIGSSAISGYLDGIIPFNPWDKNVYNNPFKIIRSRKQQRENKYNSWRSFLALDYFETIKDKGEITNLQGYDGNLIIHHEHAVYQTVSKTTLNGDILSVTLGSGDIFQLEPKEGKSSRTGIAGLQHPLHASMNDFGYTFVDIEKRVIYVINERGLQPLNGDLDPLFKEVLKGIDGIPYNSLNGVGFGYDEENDGMRIIFTLLKGEESLTFSMDLHSMVWTYGHDYFPNAYINTRNKLLNIKDGKLYRFNEGPHGVYHTSEVFPYYIDVAFVNDSAFVLNSVVWRTIVEKHNNSLEYLDELFDKTFTSVTIWNANQCTGKIDLNKNLSLPLEHNTRSPEYRWNFNKFRNLIKTPGVFLDTIFNDFRVKDGMINNNIPWHQKDLIIGDYVIVRFEFDNLENNQITVNELNIDISKSHR